MNSSDRPHPAHAASSHGPHAATAKAPRPRAKNQLLALGSAAVLAIYFAGYFRTRAAAQRYDESDATGRHPTAPAKSIAAAPAIVVPPASPAPAKLAPQSPAAPVLPIAAPAPAATSSSPVASTAIAPVATPALPTPQPPPPTPVVAPVSSSPTPSPVATSAAITAGVISAPLAPTPAAAPVAPLAESAPPGAAVAQPKWKDGAFSGWGSCRHGDIEATVEIKGGRIVSAVVTSCQTRYSCDVIDRVIPQVVARQSADVDTVSGATQSSDAFYWAVTQALGKAKPEATVKAM